MYQKPSLVRFGSFRDVTRGGGWDWSVDWAATSWREFFFHATPDPNPSAS